MAEAKDANADVMRAWVHPTRKAANRSIGIGAALCVLGAGSLVAGGVSIGVICAATGAIFVWIGRYNRSTGAAVLVNNRAFDLVARGRADEAEALLDTVPKNVSSSIQRSVAAQRALIALYLGDAAKATADATRAIKGRTHLFSRSYEEAHICGARAVRAQAFAIAGNADAALADANAARQSKAATAETLARATVAEAIVLAQREDKDALRALLEKERRVLDHAGPRERVLLRAFARMVRAPKPSVYREPAQLEKDAPEQDGLTDWIAKAAPHAAPYVNKTARAGRMGVARVVEPPPTSQAIDARTAVHRAPTGLRNAATRRGATIVVWLGLVFTFLMIWAFLQPAATHGPVVPAAPSESAITWLGASPAFLFFALFISILFIQVRRVHAQNEKLRAATLDVDVGDRARGIMALRSLADGKANASAAHALLVLGRNEERSSELREALRDVERGIERINRTGDLRNAYSDILVPDLVAERAFLLAAMGMTDGASAELAALSRDFPAYPYLTRALLRTRMVLATRANDLDAATALARERTPELPLFVRDEMLADLLVAGAGDPIPDGEIERIDAALAVDKELRAWLQAIAPAALDRYEQSRKSRTRVGAMTSADEAAHIEAQAMAEAEDDRARA